MAATIPFTPATIPYDPPRQYVLGVIPAPGSVLDVIVRDFPNIAELVNRAGLAKLYTTDNPVTIFVPTSYVYDPMMLTSDAVKLCRALTIEKTLYRLEYSPSYVLKTLASPNDLYIEKCGGCTTVNGTPLIASITCTNGIIHVIR